LRSEIYRGRLAPSPTGYLHAGHAATFWRAEERCRARNGKLILRIEDLDRVRCRPEFRAAIEEDLRWLGLHWDEGPFLQSEQCAFYLEAWRKLRDRGLIYPCSCSRRDILSAASAPHVEDDEAIYPGSCRPVGLTIFDAQEPAGVTWRFRVSEGRQMEFEDRFFGVQRATTGTDFGDFVIWRKDDVPAYQLTVVVDDAGMRITEVVRGADLLRSTFRQLLLYAALELDPPEFCHQPLVTDSSGTRLANGTTLSAFAGLQAAGLSPDDIREKFVPLGSRS
jgi:glutamyl-tRNA synthetase